MKERAFSQGELNRTKSGEGLKLGIGICIGVVQIVTKTSWAWRNNEHGEQMKKLNERGVALAQTKQLHTSTRRSIVRKEKKGWERVFESFCNNATKYFCGSSTSKSLLQVVE